MIQKKYGLWPRKAVLYYVLQEQGKYCFRGWSERGEGLPFMKSATRERGVFGKVYEVMEVERTKQTWGRGKESQHHVDNIF